MKVSREALVARIDQLSPRLVLAIAGPGWGKTSVARLLLARASLPSYCDLRDVFDREDVVRVLDEAYDSQDPARTADVFAIDDLSSLDRVGWEPFDRFLHRVRDATQLILLAHHRPDYDFSWFVAPHEMLTLTRSDLAFSEADCIELFTRNGSDEATARTARAFTLGWPVTTLMLLRVALEGRLAEGLRDPSGPLFEDLHHYIKMRVIERQTRPTIDAIVAIAALDRASADEIAAVAGSEAFAALEALIERGDAPFVTQEDGRYGLTRFVGASVRAKYDRGIRMVRAAASELFFKSGAFARAAETAAAAQMWDVAARALDRLARDRSAIDAHARTILEEMPVEWLLTSPALLSWYLATFMVRADPGELLARLREASQRRAHVPDPVARYGLELALFVGLRLANETANAIEVEQRLLETPVPTGAESLAALFTAERGVLASSVGRINDARDLLIASEMGRIPLDVQRFGVTWNELMHQGPPEELLAHADEGVRRARRLDDPAVVLRALNYRAIAMFFAGDRAAFSMAVAEALAADPRGRSLRRVGDAAFDSTFLPFHLSVLASIDAAFEGTDATVAASLLDDVIRAADAVRKPFWSVLARLARAGVPGGDCRHFLERALELARLTQAPHLVKDVEAAIAGDAPVGPLRNLPRIVESSPLLRASRIVRVSFVDGAVTRGEATLAVRAREFEILALLALNAAAMSSEEICDEVWPQADPEASLSALRMSVHRLRKQLDDADAVLSVPQGYRVGDCVTCDIADAERTIAACRRMESLGAYERARLRELFATFAAPAMPVSSRFAWYGRIESRLVGIRHALGVVLGRDALAHSDPAGAIELAEALLLVDPYDEPAIELLVRGLDAAGERAEAIRRFRQYAERLKVEYGVDTSIELAELLDLRKTG